MDAGRLDRRFRFEKRQKIKDGAGNTVGGWQYQFTQAGNRKWLRGGESVLAGRLENRQPAILTVRNSAQARGVGNDWRVIDERDGREYAIHENPKETDDGGFLEMLIESGVATQ